MTSPDQPGQSRPGRNQLGQNQLWPRHDVRRRRSDRKPFRHPLVGEFTLSYEVLHLDDGQRMTVYQAAPGSRDHDAMTLLSMIANGERAPRDGSPPS